MIEIQKSGDRRAWSGFIWLRTRTTGGLLWTQLLTQFFAVIGGDYLNGLGFIYGKGIDETS